MGDRGGGRGGGWGVAPEGPAGDQCRARSWPRAGTRRSLRGCRCGSRARRPSSNQTNPSSPYVWMPANRSAILSGWLAAGVALVSAMRIGSGSARVPPRWSARIWKRTATRFEVVAVDPHPGHIRAAGPPGRRVGNLAVL